MISTSNNTETPVNQSINNNDNEEQLNIKVINSDGAEVYFKVKRDIKLKKLMDAYCKRQGMNSGSLRFNFDGERINPQSTPLSLGMEDKDVIDALQEQTGGYLIFA